MASGLRPGLRALRAHDGRALRSDLIAGITVAAFLVPQVLAYAGVAGLPAVTGLWAATAALGCYALLGSSRQLSLGPESTTALLTASTVGPLAAGDPHRYAAIAAALAVLVGAICLLGRLARLGFLADMLPRPVLVGYLTGIALIMIAGQLENVTGVPVEGGAFLADIASLAGHIELVHGPTLGMSTTVLAFLLVRGRSSAAPGTWAAGGRAHGGRGERAVRAGPGRHARGRTVPEGLPVPAVPAITLDDIALLLPAALGDRSGLVVYRYDAPLCFANAENLRNRALAVLEVEPATRWLLLNMEAVIEIDLTAADAVHSAA